MTAVTLISHIIEFFVFYIFLSSIFYVKFKQPVIIVAGLASYMLIFSVFMFFNSTIINIISVSIYIFAFSMIFFDCKIRDAVFSSLFLNAALTASEFLTINVLSLSSGNINAFKNSTINYVLTVLICKVLFLIVTALVGSFFPKGQKDSLPLFLFLFPVSSTLALYVLWYLSANNDISKNMGYIITVVGSLMVASVLLTYIFYSKTTNELKELHKVRSENIRISADEAYYEILDKQNEQLKTILHDEKNHLAAIKSLADSPEVSKYIDEIYGKIELNSRFGNTKNKVLDLTIGKYFMICEKEDIKFCVSVKTANLHQMADSDLISLLGNILDNAVESAKMSKERRIDFSLNRVNGIDVLSCVNSCDSAPKTDGKHLISTKSDKNSHGLGFKSIAGVVKKYKGNIAWAYDEDLKRFSVNVSM